MVRGFLCCVCYLHGTDICDAGFALQTGRFADQKKSTLSMKFDLNRAVNTLSRNKILTQVSSVLFQMT